MSLKEYRKKRRFDVTSEPAGDRQAATGQRFVVQKHAATRLHYDFRLEHDGVLKSWAVPHGPSLDPTVKSLAVQVEDHPVDYATFEGTIPKGQYGGGTVMVWDQGTWQSLDPDVGQALKRGKLSFTLQGEKLSGAWTLVQMKSRGEENWLLLKQRDEFAVSEKSNNILESKPKSVITGRDMSQIADGEKPVAPRRSKKKVTAQGVATKSESSLATSVKDGSEPRRSRKSSTSKTIPREKPAASANSASSVDRREVLRHLRQTSRGKLPDTIQPQLATLADEVPQGDEWIHEVKLDGYRILARCDGSDVQLFTRKGLDWTHRFPTIARSVAQLKLKGAWLDGEVVALDDRGVSNFQRLQNGLSENNESQFVYYVFDLPWAESRDLTDLSLTERKAVLAEVLKSQSDQSHVRFHDHIAGSGSKVLKNACRLTLEGIISKHRDGKYEPRRSDTWLKIKCAHHQEFVVGGYTEPSGNRKGLGALLLGYYRDKRLVYCGRVGTGFNETSLKDLVARMKPLKTDVCPFDDAPTGAQLRGVHWLRPKLVAEISYATRTDDGILRQSVFHGLREDKSPTEIVLERPVMHARSLFHGKGTKRSDSRKPETSDDASESDESPTDSKKPASTRSVSRTSERAKRKSRVNAEEEAIVAQVTITHPERLVFTDPPITKLDLIEYLKAVSDWMLPFVAARPITLVRCPQGPTQKCFYQKHMDDALPEGVTSVDIKEEHQSSAYPVIKSLKGLIGLAQLNAIEFHPWPALARAVEKPDRMIIDLDPGEGCSWQDVVEGAQLVREILSQVKLKSFVRTTGGKGLHVVTPIRAGSCTWDELKTFAKLLADSLAEKYPTRYVSTISKAARRGKVFVDYLRNQRGATAVASYSPRARPGAPVSVPLEWKELSDDAANNQFNVQTVLSRLKKRRRDPWAGFAELKQKLPSV